MTKTITSLTVILATTALAQAPAQPQPAPPTEAYTPAQQLSCDTQSLQVYFADGDSALTNASHQLLIAAQSELDGCIVGPVSLTASAADAPSPREAKTLAQARLNTVTQALKEVALSGARIDAHYETASVPAALVNPRARAVEIELTAWAPQIG